MITQEKFDEVESSWRSRLTGLSLVVEADADPDQAADAFGILGYNFGLLGDKEARQFLLFKYRAALLVGLCAVGAREYDEGVFWPSVAEAFQQPLTQNLQSELSTAFRRGLDFHGLSRFTTPQRNIGEILMHAGVPIPSLEGYLRVLMKQDSQLMNLDGRQLSAWARTMSAQGAAAFGLDAPTWRFLSEGGEISEDFTDRCLALIDQFQTTTSTEASDLSLPSHIVAEFERLFSTGAFDETKRDRKARRQREVDLVPHLVFSRADGVQLRLPPLQTITETAIEWRVSAEGTVHTIDVPAPWPGDPVNPVLHTLRPAKVVTVTITPGDRVWELELVDTDDPLIIFDASTGQWVPPRNSLPKGTAWILAPNQENLPLSELLEADGDLVKHGEMDAPYGWEGWTIVEVDLTNVDRLRIPSSDRWRYISTITRPQLQLDDPIDFLSTVTGDAIYATKPLVALPGAAEGSIEWKVLIHRHGSETALISRSFTVGEGQTSVDPWESSDHDELTGEFDIHVRGPLGRGMTARIALAEGVRIQTTHAFRPMLSSGTGLAPAIVTVIRGDESSEIKLSESEPFHQHLIAADGEKITTVIALPHMTVTQRGAQLAPITTILPQRVEAESLATTQLRVSVPPNAAVTLVALSKGDLIQTVQPGVTGRGYAQFNLAQLSESLSNNRNATLMLAFAGERIPVASVQPKRLARAINIDADGVLHVLSDSPIPGLGAALYPDFAPWAPPYELHFEKNSLTVQLSKEMMEEGRGQLVLRVEDPWAIEPWPSTPVKGSNSFDVELGELSSETDMESQYRRWLARVGACPTEASGLALALTIYPKISTLRTSTEYAVLRKELADSIGINRVDVFSTILESAVNPSQLFRAFVASELVTVDVKNYGVPAEIWASSVLLGVLGRTHLLGGPDESIYRDNLFRFVGPAAHKILDSKKDPFASTGIFGSGARVMHPWPPERVDDVWKVVAPVPGRTLDKDSRAIAAKALFDVRRSREIQSLCSSSRRLLDRIRSIVFASLGVEGCAPITARESDDGWASLPTISIGLALCARLAARGDLSARGIFLNHQDEYAELAHLAPAVVEQDLVLAELWISAHWKES